MVLDFANLEVTFGFKSSLLDNVQCLPFFFLEGRKRQYKKRTSQRAALDILAEKYETKASLKDKELELRKMELEFQKEKFETEAKEREAKMQMELEERKLMITLLKDKL